MPSPPDRRSSPPCCWEQESSTSFRRLSVGSRVRESEAPALPGARGAGCELRARCSPLGLLIDCARGDAAQLAQGAAPGLDHCGGELAARRLIHEGHELVGEAGHSAADANTTDVWAAAHPVHPAAFGNVALDHRAPAAELDDALGRAVFGGEVRLLVVASPVTTLVHRPTE